MTGNIRRATPAIHDISPLQSVICHMIVICAERKEQVLPPIPKGKSKERSGCKTASLSARLGTEKRKENEYIGRMYISTSRALNEGSDDSLRVFPRKRYILIESPFDKSIFNSIERTVYYRLHEPFC